MDKLIKNEWRFNAGKSFATVQILQHDMHPEGLDVNRIWFMESGRLVPSPSVGHLFSVIEGSARLTLSRNGPLPLYVEKGVHLYLPAGIKAVLQAEAGTELVCVSSASASQARGKELLVRDETFLAACASESRLLRWTITPQYLSRRIFLRHDPTLLSKSGNPVSWFHTTMFEVAGLPNNEDGEPVFKMSYNSRTEFNVCYAVKGTARVRMAQHPYREKGQAWGPWLPLDGDSTYHLNETAGCPEEECRVDELSGSVQYLRNKHEVYIMDGYVSLFCMFDPAPTGMERHRPGEYSDYEPLSQILGTREHEIYRRETAKYDEMVDRLSLAKAKGELDRLLGTPIWELYLRGLDAQRAIERGLSKALAEQGAGREQVLAPWMQTGAVHRHPRHQRLQTVDIQSSHASPSILRVSGSY